VCTILYLMLKRTRCPRCVDRDVDKVDDLIDDIRDEMDTASHISDAISTPLDSSMQSDVRTRSTGAFRLGALGADGWSVNVSRRTFWQNLMLLRKRILSPNLPRPPPYLRDQRRWLLLLQVSREKRLLVGDAVLSDCLWDCPARFRLGMRQSGLTRGSQLLAFLSDADTLCVCVCMWRLSPRGARAPSGPYSAASPTRCGGR
jgi:hypothetical protein